MQMEENTQQTDKPPISTPTAALNVLINLGQVCLQSGVFSEDDCKMIYDSLFVFEKKMEEGENFTIKVKPDDIEM